MSVYGGPNIVKNGLVLDLDAANPKSYPSSGTTWTDLTGNGSNLTLNNGPTFDSNNGGSIVYDGINDDSTTTRTWNDIKGSSWGGYLTMEGFFKTTTTPTNGQMGYFGFQSASAYFKFMNTSYLFLDCYSTIPSRVITKVTNDTTYFGSWIHVCGVYDGTAKTYYNGVLQNVTTAFTLADISSLSFVVGNGMGYFNFQGNLSGVKIYNRALSDSEVQQNFNAHRGRFGL